MKSITTACMIILLHATQLSSSLATDLKSIIKYSLFDKKNVVHQKANDVKQAYTKPDKVSSTDKSKILNKEETGINLSIFGKITKTDSPTVVSNATVEGDSVVFSAAEPPVPAEIVFPLSSEIEISKNTFITFDATSSVDEPSLIWLGFGPIDILDDLFHGLSIPMTEYGSKYRAWNSIGKKKELHIVSYSNVTVAVSNIKVEERKPVVDGLIIKVDGEQIELSEDENASNLVEDLLEVFLDFFLEDLPDEADFSLASNYSSIYNTVVKKTSVSTFGGIDYVFFPFNFSRNCATNMSFSISSLLKDSENSTFASIAFLSSDEMDIFESYVNDTINTNIDDDFLFDDDTIVSNTTNTTSLDEIEEYFEAGEYNQTYQNVSSDYLMLALSNVAIDEIQINSLCKPDETDTSGDETDTSGDETDTSGDETDTSGDETDTSGDETDTSGDETDTSGDETDTSGDETDDDCRINTLQRTKNIVLDLFVDEMNN